MNQVASRQEQDQSEVVLQEIVVVEGVRDAAAVQRAVNADTLVVRGIRIHRSTMLSIQRAQEVRGVIVFTDPDYAGNAIRRRISDCVSGVAHAYLSRKEAISGNKVGVEHASDQAIRAALLKARVHSKEDLQVSDSQLSWEDYYSLGFVGSVHSRQLRERVAGLLHANYGNGKQFYKHLRALHVSPEELLQAWKKACS